MRAIINTFVGWYMLLLSYLKVQFIVRKKYHLCLHNYLHSTLKPVHFCIRQNAVKNFFETKVLRKNLGQNSAHRPGFITILCNLVNSWWWWGSIWLGKFHIKTITFFQITICWQKNLIRMQTLPPEFETSSKSGIIILEFIKSNQRQP